MKEFKICSYRDTMTQGSEKGCNGGSKFSVEVRDIDSYSLKENKALVCKMNRSKIVLKNWYHKIMTLADHFFFTVIIDYARYYGSIYKVEINTYIQTINC